jgi:hypothetical protein
VDEVVGKAVVVIDDEDHAAVLGPETVRAKPKLAKGLRGNRTLTAPGL